MNVWTSFKYTYEVRHLVGRDALSSTYTARRKSDGKVVAAREFLLSSMRPDERDAVDDEIAILQRVVHPNIPSYKEIRFSCDSKVMYVITSYVQSVPLSQLIQEKRAQRDAHLDERAIWSIAADLADLLQFVLLPQKINFLDGEQIDFLSLTPQEVMIDASMRVYVRSFKSVKEKAADEARSVNTTIPEKASLYECCIPGAALHSIEQRNLYIIGLFIYELALLTPYNYFSPIGPWPSCPAKHIFFPLYSSELCKLCQSLLDVTQNPRLTVNDIVNMEQIRDVHPVFAVEEIDALNQKTEMISSRYNTEMESYSSRVFSYSTLMKQTTLEHTINNDTPQQGADRGSIELADIFRAPMGQLQGTPNTVTPIHNRPVSPSRVIIDALSGTEPSSSTTSVPALVSLTPQMHGRQTPTLPSGRGSVHIHARTPTTAPMRTTSHEMLRSSLHASLCASVSKVSKCMDGSTAQTPLDVLRGPKYLSAYPFLQRPAYRFVEQQTDLMKAAIAGDTDLVRMLVETEAGCILQTGETALYYALIHGKQDIAELLLLHEGIAVNSEAFPEALIRNQEGPYRYNDYKTPLIKAALEGDIVGVYSLMKYYARLQDNTGKTALIHAIESKNSVIAGLLARVEYGLVDKKGMYATLAAVLHGDVNTFRLVYVKESGLLKGSGFTPLMISAALNNENAVVSQLQKHKAMRTKTGLTALIVAVHSGSDNLSIIEHLSAHEAGIRDEQGKTALMHAIRLKKENAVRALVDFEGQVTDTHGQTPLMHAARESFSQVVELFSRQVGKADNAGKTALMHAIETNNIVTAAMLVNAEAGVQDVQGETALMKAIKHKLPSIGKLLIPTEAGYKDNSGNFAAQLAIKHGDKELLKQLLPHEINLLYEIGFTDLMIDVGTMASPIPEDCLAQNTGRQAHNGLTALMLAAIVDNRQAAISLLDEADLADEDGFRAIDYARKCNNMEIVNILTRSTNRDDTLKDYLQPRRVRSAIANKQHRSSFLTSGTRNSIEDKIPAITAGIRESSNERDQFSVSDPFLHVGTATPQALFTPTSSTPRGHLMRSVPASAEFINSGAPRSANTSVFSAGSIRSKSFNSIRRTIEMENKYEGYEPDGQRNSAKLPKRPISAVSIRPDVASTQAIAKLCGITETDFTSLSLEADSLLNDFTDRNSITSPGMNFIDLSCDEITINTRKSASQAPSSVPLKNTSRNPLLVAALINDGTVVSKYLHQTRRTYGKSNKTALIVAADRGNTEVVRQLEPYEGGLATSSGWTALMRATLHNYIDCINILVEKEARMQNHKYVSALMIATELGHTEAVLRLAGEEGGLRDAHDYTALMLGAKRGYSDIVEIIAPHEAKYTRGNGVTALMYAIQNRHTSCVRVLAEHEAGMRLDNGWTALMMAAQNGFLDAVEILKGAEGRMKNANGTTALMLAAQNKRLAAVRLLIDTEATLTNSQGATALMMAAENGSILICQILEPHERGLVTKNGSTALMFAARVGNVDIVTLLIHSEAGRQSSTGHTALMLSAQAGAVDVCALLLKKEGGLRTHDNTTALMLAAHAGHLKVVELLAPTEAGMRRNDGATACLLAEAKGHADCVRVLRKFESQT